MTNTMKQFLFGVLVSGCAVTMVACGGDSAETAPQTAKSAPNSPMVQTIQTEEEKVAAGEQYFKAKADKEITAANAADELAKLREEIAGDQ